MSEIDKLTDMLDEKSSKASQEDLQIANIFGEGPLAETLKSSINAAPNYEAIESIKESNRDLQSYIAERYRTFVDFVKEATDYFFEEKEEQIKYQVAGEKKKTKTAKTKLEILEEEYQRVLIDLESSKVFTALQLSKLNNFIQKANSASQLDRLKTTYALLRDRRKIEDTLKLFNSQPEYKRIYEDTQYNIASKISEINARRIDSGEDAFNVLANSDDSTY